MTAAVAGPAPRPVPPRTVATRPPVPRDPRPVAPRDRLRGLLVGGAATVAATVLVALHDPHVYGSYGLCPLYALTGVYCPACGALRATHDVTRLHLAAAWSENPLWVAVAPLVVVAWLVAVTRRARGLPARRVPACAQAAGLAVVVVFGVLRNLPAFAWMAP